MMRRVPSWAWSVIRIVVVAFICWQIVSYLWTSHEQNTQPGWPVSNEPADSEEK